MSDDRRVPVCSTVQDLYENVFSELFMYRRRTSSWSRDELSIQEAADQSGAEEGQGGVRDGVNKPDEMQRQRRLVHCL